MQRLSGGFDMSMTEAVTRIKDRMDADDTVRVSITLFGQPGCGKASLIHRLLGQKLAQEGVRNDVTTVRKDFEWNGLGSLLEPAKKVLWVRAAKANSQEFFGKKRPCDQRVTWSADIAAERGTIPIPMANFAIDIE